MNESWKQQVGAVPDRLRQRLPQRLLGGALTVLGGAGRQRE